ncbi:MAG: hypothetical protein HC907_29210 [Richelia sp. SM1_7_0]|nr:hypothetical protein [Richelia sp. SM1_7_0]
MNGSNIILKFYKNSFRGKVADIGTIAAPPIDWRAKLVEAETKFYMNFVTGYAVQNYIKSALQLPIINYQLSITNYQLPKLMFLSPAIA